MSIMPIQKFGIALPITEIPEMSRSVNVFLFTAEITPSGTAINTANNMAAAASSKLAGNRSNTSSSAG
ncbi:hypothetical protein D3C75_1197140 [compost metagenome]